MAFHDLRLRAGDARDPRRAHKRGKTVLFLTYGNRLPEVVRYLLERLAGEGAPELAAVECTTVHKWVLRLPREVGQAAPRGP